MTDETQIRIKKTTRDRLDSIGKRGETFDEIINRALDGAGAVGGASQQR